MIILRVGDPHVKVANIEESEKLVAFIADLAIKTSVNVIEILGDLFHTHAIMRLEVLDFWLYTLEHISDICEVRVLVGNHDLTGDSNTSISALDVFEKLNRKNLRIINTPRVEGVIGYCPYIHDNQKFVESANRLVDFGAKILVCHQTFSGAQYENGFYDPNGIDQTLLNFPTIVSGHIHKQQKIGKVIYPGTPRWDTISDANQPKGVWIYSHDDVTGAILKEEFISTESVCQPILSFVFKEKDAIVPVFPSNAKVALELIGSFDWVSKQKEIFKGKASIKTKISDKIKLENRKSGLDLAQFVANYSTSVDKNKLLQYMKELQLV